jgi:hypothetical protein
MSEKTDPASMLAGGDGHDSASHKSVIADMKGTPEPDETEVENGSVEDSSVQSRCNTGI